jgi:hypothetical protein
MTTWTPGMDFDLKRFWAEGHSSGEISKRMRVSPDAVLARLSMLGETGKPPCRKRGAPRHKLEPQNTPDPRDPDHRIDTRDLAMLAKMAGGQWPESVAKEHGLPDSYTRELWRVYQAQDAVGERA